MALMVDKLKIYTLTEDEESEKKLVEGLYSLKHGGKWLNMWSKSFSINKVIIQSVRLAIKYKQ